MPVRGRREFAAHALKSYRRQHYPLRELIIIQDADDPTFDEPPKDVTLITNADKQWIGAKRNQAIRHAQGTYIAHFDSDDWSDVERLTIQVNALRTSGLAVCGLSSMMFWDQELSQAFIYDSIRAPRGYEKWVVGTSLVYRRDWIERYPFTDSVSNTGEDNRMVRHALEHDELLSMSHSPQLIVARIHAGNTDKFKYGSSYLAVDRSQMPQGFFE